MKEKEALFRKIKAGIRGLFQAAYVYVDSIGLNALHVFERYGLDVNITEIHIQNKDAEGLCVIRAYVAKKRTSEFEKCMDVHKRNSILLGWGSTDQCKKVVDAIHCVAES